MSLANDESNMSSENVENLRKQLEQQGHAEPPVSQRRYFHAADFKKLNSLQKDVERLLTMLEEMLNTDDSTAPVGFDPDETRAAVFKDLASTINEFLNEWSQQTAGFNGGSKLSSKGVTTDDTKDPLFHACKLLVDQVRMAITISNSPDRLQLEMIVIMLNDAFRWLTLEGVAYTIGVTAKKTQPLTFHLENNQLRTGMAGSVAADFRKGRFRIPWKRSKTPDELHVRGDDLKYLDSESRGGV